MAKLKKVYKYTCDGQRFGFSNPAEFLYTIKKHITNNKIIVCLDLKRQKIVEVHSDYFRPNISGVLYTPYKSA